MNDSDAGNALMGLEFPVEVWLASEEIELEKLLSLEPGGVLPLAKDPDGPVDLVVNGMVVASGELIVIEGNFGFKVTESTLHKLATIDSTGHTGGDMKPEAVEPEPNGEATLSLDDMTAAPDEEEELQAAQEEPAGEEPAQEEPEATEEEVQAAEEEPLVTAEELAGEADQVAEPVSGDEEPLVSAEEMVAETEQSVEEEDPDADSETEGGQSS
jgi:hypothetical protein